MRGGYPNGSVDDRLFSLPSLIAQWSFLSVGNLQSDDEDDNTTYSCSLFLMAVRMLLAVRLGLEPNDIKREMDEEPATNKCHTECRVCIGMGLLVRV